MRTARARGAKLRRAAGANLAMFVVGVLLPSLVLAQTSSTWRGACSGASANFLGQDWIDLCSELEKCRIDNGQWVRKDGRTEVNPELFREAAESAHEAAKAAAEAAERAEAEAAEAAERLSLIHI